MQQTNFVHIDSPRERVFDMVSDLTRWPEWLPHYRYVHVLERRPDGAQIVRMAARRSGIPIAWVSEYVADSATFKLHFRHLKAWTKGMVVVWNLESEGNATRVEIVHDMKFRIPPLAPIADLVIGSFFIHHVASQTLSTFKKLLEA